MYGTGIDTVIELVSEEKLPTLDDDLIASGRLEVPLIRQSWARSLQKASDGAARIIPPPEGSKVHPAITVALDFYSALEEGDEELLSSLSSSASSAGDSPAQLLTRWREACGGEFPETAGIGSVLYSLAPLPAVAARVFADAPSLPRAVDRPTPARLLAVLPLVEEDGFWKVDLVLFEDQETLASLLVQPPPGES
jgi:hypothetical protein